MLLKTFKSNHAYLFFLIPVVAIALWTKALIHPAQYAFYPGEDQMLLYKPFNYLLANNPLANNIVALIFTILLSFLILKLNVQYAFIRIKTFLSPTLFLLIASGIPELHVMHPVYPAALFLILAVDRIFNSYEKEIIHSNAFDAGIFLALGSLFYLNLVFFFPFLWIGFVILKPKVNWREYILTTIGFVLPCLLAFGYYAVTNQTEELGQILQSNVLTHQVFLREGLSIQVYVGYLVFLIMLGSILLLGQYDEKKISSRKYFKAFFWIFLISVILIFSVPAVSQEIIIISAIPLSYLISNYLIYMKRPIWGEVYLWLLVAGVIYLQFT